jgi:hypothetical protein
LHQKAAHQARCACFFGAFAGQFVAPSQQRTNTVHEDTFVFTPKQGLSLMFGVPLPAIHTVA